jgi:hypothetical protein
MAILYPTTLLIGNIHWIADENYILTLPENVLLNGQLLDFQVNHICDHLHIPTNNVFNTHIPRSYLLKEITNRIKLNPFNPPIDCVQCAQYGLICPIKDNNTYTFRNIGGKPLIEFKLNTNQTELESISESIPYDLKHPSNSENVPFTLPHRFQAAVGTHVLHGGNGVLIHKPKKMKCYTSKRRISDMYRQNSSCSIDLFGKIDDDNHTYPGMLNTPLMFLIYHISLKNKPSTIYDTDLNDIIEYYQHRLLVVKKNAKINKFMAYYHKDCVTTPIDILSTLITQLDQQSQYKIINNATPTQITKRKPLAIFLKHTHPIVKYTLMMQIKDIGWVHYDGCYNTHTQNDYFVEVGNFDEMMAYQNRMCEKHMFAMVYD